MVSVDPRRVYVEDPASSKHETVKTEKPGPNGEEYCWWQCTVKGGREGRDIGAVELSRAVEDLGAGEILLNCIDRDGQARSQTPQSLPLSKDHLMRILLSNLIYGFNTETLIGI